MKGIKIDIANKQIIMNQSFENRMNSGKYSYELAVYERLKALHPDFTFVVKKQKTYNHNKHKLSYKYIESYIYCHAIDQASRKAIFMEYIEERWKALGHTCGYHEVKAWFIQKFPDYDDMYFEKHERPNQDKIDEIMKSCNALSEFKLIEPEQKRILIR